MHFRTFYFILFIVSNILFFLSSLNPTLTLRLCGSVCYANSSLEYIQLTSMVASAISLILFIVSNYYTEKYLLRKKERVKQERLNIEQIHAELEALKKSKTSN